LKGGNLETYLRDVVTGRHFRWNGSESKKRLQRNGLMNSSRRGKIARVGALVVAALVVEARLKKNGKVNGPNESEMILLGYYIKFRPRISRVTHISWNKRLRHGEQVNRNFGIKLFLFQNWGHVFTKIWEEERGNLKLPRLCHKGIDCIRIDIS